MNSLYLICISAIILIVGTQTGSAIKCVECNSRYEPWCEDIPGDFNYTMSADNKYNKYLTNCDEKNDGAGGVAGKVNGVAYASCRIMTQKVGDDPSRTIRMCAANGKPNKCYERTGTKNVKLSYCSCDGDWCNSAPTLFTPKLVLLSLISAILALISFS